MAILTWERHDGQRQVFHLQAVETAIGREPGNAIRLESNYVSKRHAVVRLTAQGYSLADMGSANGTAVNGHRVTLALLKEGDRIELGSETLVFADQMPGQSRAAGTERKRNPALLAMIGGGGLLVVLLLVLVVMVGSDADPAGEAGPTGSPLPAQTGAPVPQQPVPAPPPLPEAAPAPMAYPPAALAPAAPGSAPSGDPNALYEMAMAHIKGQRLVEARKLLFEAATLDPRNPSIQQRLREVEATIQVVVDQHLNAGKRAFTYLRYEDAVLEWEQVVAMTEPGDPRHQQAAAGMQRARERMVRR